MTTETKIVKTVLEPVESPAIDAQDILPSDNEALELAEQELESTQSALETVDAENDRLHKELREAEEAIVYLVGQRPAATAPGDERLEKIVADIVQRATSRPPAPKFKRS